MMDHDRLLELLLETATLKRMPRTGWGMRGVPHVESVAEHSFGTALVALALAEAMVAEGQGGPFDVEKVLIMALLHDLGEVRLTDLPISAVRLIPADVKSQAEAAAISDLLAPLPAAERLAVLWQAFEDGSTPEGRLVRDADKLEMMVQCLRYEQAGSRGLDEFWQAMDGHHWHYDLTAGLYRQLKAMRPTAGG
ncbi:MAG: HD family hydrolase [Anaerolineae bacterium]|nr:HD family hydrolase [Anaerolineae bacterium]